jgi:hypothetical protein
MKSEARQPVAIEMAAEKFCKQIAAAENKKPTRSKRADLGCNLPPFIEKGSAGTKKLEAPEASCENLPYWQNLSRQPESDVDGRPTGRLLLMKEMAGEGIEPPTRGFSVLCSTN